MMKMNTKNFGILALLAALVIGIVLISGCVQQAPEKEQTEGPEATTEGKQNDSGSGGDVSAELESPYAIDYGEYQGTLPEGDDGDAYGIKWNPGDIIDILITPSKGLDIDFYGLGGPREIEPRNAGLKGEPESIRMTTDIEDKDYRIIRIVITAISGSGSYTLNITKTPQNDGNSGGDSPREYDHAIPISAGKYENSYLGSRDEADCYAIRLKAGEKAVIKITPSSELDVGIDGEDVGGEYGFLSSFSGYGINNGFKGEAEEAAITADEDGIYKFGVGKVGETKGTYTIEITVE